MPGQDVGIAVPHGFADAPLHLIAYHRFSHPLSYRDAQPGGVCVVRRHVEDEQGVPPRATHRTDPLEIGGAAEALLAAHLSAALAVWPYTTVSRIRPRSRRRRSTLRPPGVLIRLRKPCSRLRGMRFG